MTTALAISAAELERGRGDLRHRAWALGTASGNLAEQIVSLGMPLGPLEDNAGARCDPRDAIAPDQLPALIEATLPGIARERRDALYRAIHGPDAGTIAPEIQVLLLRALTPLAGLRTYPAEALVAAAEVDLLQALERSSIAPPLRPPAAITGIVKVTRICNLRCSYCHDWAIGAGARMSPETLAKAMSWLIQASGAARVNVVLHGGEPTLIGVRGMVRLLAFQSRLARGDQMVRTSVQTNATLLTPELIALLIRFDIAVSVSLDGPPEVHDQVRRDRRGGATAARVRDAIAALREAGILTGVIMVATPVLIAAGAERLVDYLVELDVTSAAIIAQRPGHDEPVDPTTTLATEDYCAFLLAVDRVRRRVAPGIDIREIDALRTALDRRAPRTCELQGECVGQYFAIEPDGAVTHCDKYDGDPTAVLGSVDQGFEAVAFGPAAARLRARASASRELVASCVWYDRCRGWCPHERELLTRSSGANGCCGLAPIFEGLAADEVVYG